MFEIIGITIVSMALVPILLFFIMSIVGLGVKTRFYRLCLFISIGWDQLLNTYLLGYPDETISSRAGKGRRAKKLHWTIIADILDFFDKDHSEKYIEYDEGKRAPPKL